MCCILILYGVPNVLSSPDKISFFLKKKMLDTDFALLLSDSVTHPSQRSVQRIAASPSCSWPKVWDHVLEKGPFGSSCALALLGLLSLHVHSDNQCQLKTAPFQLLKIQSAPTS